jgi:Protein of unknown function (DUF998)
MPKTTRPGRRAGQIRGLLRCGAWAGPVFTATFLAEGAVRDGYRPLRHPVSSLALGPRGWIQTANFAVTGALTIAGATGLRLTDGRVPGSRTGAILVAAAGAGLIGSAAFRTDPVGGYPPGTPDMPAAFTPAGTAHNLAAIPVFFGLPAAAAVYGWRSWRAGEPPGFAIYSAATAVTMPVTMALAGAGFGQSSRLGGYGGLFQRASIVTGFAWLTATSARALPAYAARHRRNVPQARPVLTCLSPARVWPRDGQSRGSARGNRKRVSARTWLSRLAMTREVAR